MKYFLYDSSKSVEYIAIADIIYELKAINWIPLNYLLYFKMNSLNVICYFDKEKTELKYNINYTINEYQPGRFQLRIEKDEEGYYPNTKEYYFDYIESISKEYLDDECAGFLNINFITSQKTTFKYSFNRFTKEDLESVYNFVISKVIKIN